MTNTQKKMRKQRHEKGYRTSEYSNKKKTKGNKKIRKKMRSYDNKPIEKLKDGGRKLERGNKGCNGKAYVSKAYVTALTVFINSLL